MVGVAMTMTRKTTEVVDLIHLHPTQEVAAIHHHQSYYQDLSHVGVVRHHEEVDNNP